VYDELVFTIIENIKELNLSYRVTKAVVLSRNSQGNSQEELKDRNEQELLEQQGAISYQVNNKNHQQYLNRIADFIEILLPQCHD